VTISGASAVTSTTSGDGRAGDIAVKTERLTLTDGSAMLTSTGAAGDAGNITIDANESVHVSSFSVLTSSSDVGPGNAGQIMITTPTLTVDQGGAISTSTTGTGNAGSITVNANSVSLLSGGQLTSSSTVLDPDAPPTGSAGTVTIQGLASPAQSVLIDGAGSGIFTSTEGSGTGGSIFVNAYGVTLQNQAHVSSSSTGPGPNAGRAGDITINAGNQFTMTNSSVTTEADQSSGGAIKIGTNPNGTVQLTNSTISASVLDGTGGGGSVSIDPQFVLLQNSQILANAVFGPGGNIFITTNLLLPDATSLISASSQFGQNGTITIQSPIAPASGKILPLPQKPLIATTLLSQRCAALAGGNYSSFTVAGRDSLPAEPAGWLSSPLALVALSGSTGQEVRGDGEGLSGLSGSFGAKNETNQNNEINQINQRDEINQTNQSVLSLRRIAPPGFLTQSFAADWSAGCTS
jgi:large exoprotein involved in heme utilization and adhesion